MCVKSDIRGDTFSGGNNLNLSESNFRVADKLLSSLPPIVTAKTIYL